MKAILCKNYGQPKSLVFEEVQKPTPNKNQVLIKTSGCSINFPDTLIIQGKYQFKPDLPFIPGSNVSGTIVETGKNNSQFKIGDPVMGITLIGGLSEYTLIDKSTCFLKPNSLTYYQASAFLYTYATAYYALVNRGQLKKKETVLILGASGGVGSAAIQIAKALGATVIAAASTDKKLENCKQMGADFLINYTTQDLKSTAKKMTNNVGVNMIMDTVGGDVTNQAIRTISWGGRYLVVGFAHGNIPKLPLNLVLLKSCQIVGVFLGGYIKKDISGFKKMVQDLLTLQLEKLLVPHISQTFDLSESPKAIQMMIDRKVIGKLVVKI